MFGKGIKHEEWALSKRFFECFLLKHNKYFIQCFVHSQRCLAYKNTIYCLDTTGQSSSSSCSRRAISLGINLVHWVSTAFHRPNKLYSITSVTLSSSNIIFILSATTTILSITTAA